MKVAAKLFAVLLSFAASVAAAAPPASAQAQNILEYKGWKVRWGVAAAPDKLASLVGKAEAFAVDVVKFKDEATGENRLLGSGEAHGMYPVPLEAAVAAVLNYKNLKAISPRVREVRVYENGPPLWKVYEDIGVDFLGISVGYKLDAETYRDDLTDGVVAVRGRMLKSHDGKLYEADSSWYFTRLSVGGVEYTYMRTYSTSGLREPGAGIASILKLFTAGDLRDQVAAVAKAAAASKL
ncbi:MAG TPA: hypothetical protein VN445_12070 [Rectinemataceae bacterium]|nr:hypothetical protein [Rectinemataceae bacterium]